MRRAWEHWKLLVFQLSSSVANAAAALVIVVTFAIVIVASSAKNSYHWFGYWAEHGNLPKKDCALNACLCCTCASRMTSYQLPYATVAYYSTILHCILHIVHVHRAAMMANRSLATAIVRDAQMHTVMRPTSFSAHPWIGFQCDHLQDEESKSDYSKATTIAQLFILWKDSTHVNVMKKMEGRRKWWRYVAMFDVNDEAYMRSSVISLIRIQWDYTCEKNISAHPLSFRMSFTTGNQTLEFRFVFFTADHE